MDKYYHKCSVCEKTVKREKPNCENRIICNSCKKIENTINCKYCGKQFFRRKAIRIFCSCTCSGKYLGEHVLKGKIVTIATREKLSKIATERNCGFIKTKFYKVFSPYQNKFVSLQGTYELKYAEYLNENNINWVRSKEMNIQYMKDDGVNRNYFPDFYLPDSDEYVEIKGYFFPKDKEKMETVVKQNPMKKIRMLFKEDLINLKVL